MNSLILHLKIGLSKKRKYRCKMKAVNPKTGKPITIMRTEANLTKTNRTLLWFRDGLTGSNDRWQRWSTIITEDDPIVFEPDIIFLYGIPTSELKEKWTKWFCNSPKSFIIASPQWLVALKLNVSTNSSILATTEIYQRYPFLTELKDTDSKDKWLLCIAQMMRFHKFVVPVEIKNEQNIFNGTIKVIDHYSIAENVVPAIWLIQQYYQPTKSQRAKEINRTLEKNIECTSIDKIILLNEKLYDDIPTSSKIEQVNINHRLTYYDVLNYIKTHIPKDTIVIFANSDIYMDSTLNQLYNIDLHMKFLALLRYDVQVDAEPVIFGPRADSQDTWIVWSSSIDFEITEADFGFNFGISGCDNALTVAMLKKKFVVSNPAYSIKTYHLHNSNIRTYVTSDVIDKPLFLYVEPTGIQDYNVVKDIAPYKVHSWKKNNPRTFARSIKYVDKVTAETICNMMVRNDTTYKYIIDSPNIFNKAHTPTDDILYKFVNNTNTIFTMPTGVVCDYNNLYVSENPVWRKAWTDVPLTILANTVHVPSMIAVYFPPEIVNSASQWFLRYLPNVLRVHTHTNETPEFIVSTHPDTQKALQLLVWSKENITMIPYLQDCQYVSESVYALTPPNYTEIPGENIDILRKMLPPVEPNSTPRAIIVADRGVDAIMSNDFCSELIKNIFHRKDRGMWSITIVDSTTPTESRLRALMNADLVVSSSENEWDALDWIWLMQNNKTVVEIMPDIKPRGDHIHLAGASNLNYVLIGVKREPLPYQRQHIIEDMEKVMKEHLFSETLKAQVPRALIPLVTLPYGKALSGIHEHTGDTFREMVKIWEERNYCIVERREDTPYVWWQGIGNVLLYDRPTMRWLDNPAYNLALFGNSCPEKLIHKDRVWSFWPRSPRAIESMVATNKPLISYEERKIPSIFLGRIENGVQKERRTTHDWQSVIHTFHMPIDSTGGEYKYNQEEYLDLLCQSRFGLCLPGYGPKCNREIEYFATGTVPIITPGVDMTNYSAKPKENIHYFLAKTPEDVKKIVDTTSQEKWTEMSIAIRAWWRRYASAEGLFRLTWGIVDEHQHQHGPNCKH